MRRIFALVLVAVFVGVSLATVGSSDLSGVWAQLVVSSQLSDVPFAGRVRQQTISIQRVNIQQSGGTVTLEAQTCALEFDSGTPLVKLSFPERFVNSLGIDVKQAQFDPSTLSFVQPRTTYLRGVRLQDPERDPLPTDPKDPAHLRSRWRWQTRYDDRSKHHGAAQRRDLHYPTGLEHFPWAAHVEHNA
jgi:hypothetical protein